MILGIANLVFRSKIGVYCVHLAHTTYCKALFTRNVCICVKRREWVLWQQMMVFTDDVCFLVAPSLPRGATYLVTMVSVCMYVCLFVCLSVCLDVTFSVKGKIFDNRFGLIHVRTPKIFFSSVHLLISLFSSLHLTNFR